MFNWRDAEIIPLGDRALTIRVGKRINESTFQLVRNLVNHLTRSPLKGSTEIVPSYLGLTIYYDLNVVSFESIASALRGHLERVADDLPSTSPRIVTIPVCYGEEFGEDLSHVAEHCRMTTNEVIEIHTSAEYLVHMIGFAPGFPYLGGMPTSIATPRRETPRLKLDAGSVGIAGEQTGIYPIATPGGWQIIGRTPLALFLPDENPPSLLRAGDRVRFQAITADSFRTWSEHAP